MILHLFFAVWLAFPSFGVETKPAPNLDRIKPIYPSQTRSLRRGGLCPPLVLGERIIPQHIVKYSEEFAAQIAGEFVVPYGHDDDPDAFKFFLYDGYEGSEKIAMQKALGYDWPPRYAGPESWPDWLQLARSYRDEAVRLRIPLDQTFVPGMVFVREVGSKKEYAVIDPLSEDIPDPAAGWRTMTKYDKFNIPFAAVIKAMGNGKFPMMDAIHDVSHFVAFLRFPEYARHMRDRSATLDPSEYTPGFKRRMYWLLESLSLPDPSGRAKVEAFLRAHRRPLEPSSVSSIKRALARRSEDRLVEYALKLAENYAGSLRDVSGGNSNSPEKFYYLSEILGLRADDVARNLLRENSDLSAIVELHEAYFLNDEIHFNGNSKPMTNETAVFSFSTLGEALRYLALALRDMPDAPVAFQRPGQPEVTRANLLSMLRDFTAAVEYSYANGSRISYAEWANAFFVPELKLDHPVARHVAEIFPNAVIRNLYLGRGDPR